LKEIKKILYTIPNFDTAGSGKALLNIATRLNNEYFEPQICCSHNRGKLFKFVVESGIPIHLKNTTSEINSRIKGIIFSLKLARFFHNLKVDLIHSFHYGPDYLEALAASLAGIPWIYTKKNMNWGGKSKNSWKIRTFLSKHILAQNKDMVIQFFPHKKNVSLVPRGIDIDEFSPRKKCKDLLKKYKIKENEKIILTVANLVPVKNIEILVKAYELLILKYNNLRLFIVGDKNNVYARGIEEYVMNLKCSNKIHFTGKVQNVSDYYSIADLFVFPGKKEGCPVALLEAMAFELPVAASDVPGTRDILQPFSDNMFISDNVQSLKKLMINLLEKPNYRYTTLFRSHIIEHYDISIEVANHESIYKYCLNL